MKGQKGITLVALVITIIVMLILVVVTVTIAADGGLFSTARKAANETNEAAAKEKEIADGMINGKNFEAIAKGEEETTGTDTAGD